MRTVETDKGEVEIPEEPKVIFSDYYLGEFLAVGVKPTIASPYALSNPFLADYVDGIQEMNTTNAPTKNFSATLPIWLANLKKRRPISRTSTSG